MMWKRKIELVKLWKSFLYSEVNQLWDVLNPHLVHTSRSSTEIHWPSVYRYRIYATVNGSQSQLAELRFFYHWSMIKKPEVLLPCEEPWPADPSWQGFSHVGWTNFRQDPTSTRFQFQPSKISPWKVGVWSLLGFGLFFRGKLKTTSLEECTPISGMKTVLDSSPRNLMSRNSWRFHFNKNQQKSMATQSRWEHEIHMASPLWKNISEENRHQNTEKNSLPCRHFRPRNVKVNHVVPVPVAPPPRQVITFWCPGWCSHHRMTPWRFEVEFESEPRHKVMVHTHAYDCNEGGAFPPDM